MFRKLTRRARAIQAFQRALYRGTPLKAGRESRIIARHLRYDPDRAEALIDGAVDFEPRETYPQRAVAWAKAR